MLKKIVKKLYVPATFLTIVVVQGSERVFAESAYYLGKVMGSVYNLIYPVAIMYGVFEIIVAGYGIMRSEGEPKALMDAKSHLTDSIIGVLFVMLAAVILKVIMKSFLAQDLNL